MNICVIGASGQGKTTLVKRLVSDLKLDGVDAVEVPEYARTYIENYGVADQLWEQVNIMNGQLSNEKLAKKTYQVSVCDSPAWLSIIYASHIFDHKNQKELTLFKDLLLKAVDGCYKYDYTFYLAKVFEVQKDKVREQWAEDCEKQAEKIDSKILSFMDLFGVNYIQINEKDIVERVSIIRSVIGY